MLSLSRFHHKLPQAISFSCTAQHRETEGSRTTASLVPMERSRKGFVILTVLLVAFMVSTQGGRDTPKGQSEEEVYNPQHFHDHDHDNDHDHDHDHHDHDYDHDHDHDHHDHDHDYDHDRDDHGGFGGYGGYGGLPWFGGLPPCFGRFPGHGYGSLPWFKDYKSMTSKEGDGKAGSQSP